ncbi:RNA polymerase sigma factor [Aliikangiella sp. IMCC44359]|uniref:RNA polymerase sigma factor n=1 Tax=Aliikangiella sp. IMCC44359 TaxID=3459125 RepID=UPI00403B04B5
MNQSRTLEQLICGDVTLAQRGDVQAFTRLVEQTRQTVSSIALAIVRDLDNSEEVAQQVFIACWKNINQLKNSNSFLPWLRQMTRYTAYNFLRDSKTQHVVRGEQAESLLAEFCDPSDSHENIIERQQQSLILDEFISNLPEESREIVLLYYREEQSAKQVAELLGLSSDNVRQKLHRVKKSLKQSLLSRYGKLILSSSPGIGFSAIILNALSHTSPVAAATISTSIASSKPGFIGKLLGLLGGAVLGIASGIAAIFYGANQAYKKTPDKDSKQQIIKYRNQTALCFLVIGILFLLSFKLTSGWFWPCLLYSLMVLGVVRQSTHMNEIATKNFMQIKNPDAKAIRQYKIQKLCGLWGSIIGFTAGFAGLIWELVNSGRI